jgi:hypothetical protein
MPDVPQRPRERKDAEPSLVLRRLDALIAAAEDLSDAWDPILDAGGYPFSHRLFHDLIETLHHWRVSAKEMHSITTPPPPPLALFDPNARRAWFEDLHNSIDDALAAADDATLPLGQRTLGRATARQQVLESRHALRLLLEAAGPPMTKP